MRHTARRMVIGLGGLVVASAWVASLGAMAAASPSAPTSPALHSGLVAVAKAAAPTRSVATYVPARHALYPGMRGRAVRRMQRRLAYLHYYPGAIDGYYGLATEEAVWAFKEVQGIQTSRHADVVGRVMQRDLVHPRLPKVLVRHRARNRVEVNQNIEVLVLYHDNKIRLISHVSTGAGCLPGQGCGWITPDGNYRALWFAAGWVHVPLGEMYNPVFFIGGAYAIHGDIPVPLQPASHGCVRIPMDIAQFFHKLVHLSYTTGTRIFIRGTAPGT
jgi:L,D-transpeptidase catalytic domain/Putative peptidoglycan binding domain